MPKVHSLLVSAVVGIKEERALFLVRQGLEKGIEPFVLLEDVRTGLEIVGDMYNQGKYFLADLIVAAEIYKQVQKITLGELEESINPKNPQVIFGTVEKDIHDIGKNITISTMQHYGLAVLDLGVNVAPKEFVKTLLDTGAPVLCLSGLISDSYDSMKETVSLVRKHPNLFETIIIIGGLVNQTVCDYIGADYWVKNCTLGVDICRKVLNQKEKLLHQA
ncbi:MAG: cobalamin-dependent protein [Bacillota bacterium]